MVQDWYGGVACQHEIAVHTVDEEVGMVVGRGWGRDCLLSCSKRLRNCSAAEDATRSRAMSGQGQLSFDAFVIEFSRMPKRSSIGEDIL